MAMTENCTIVRSSSFTFGELADKESAVKQATECKAPLSGGLTTLLASNLSQVITAPPAAAVTNAPAPMVSTAPAQYVTPSTSEPSTPKAERHVRFGESSEVEEIVTLLKPSSEMSLDELSELYYQQSDFNESIQELREDLVAVKLAEKGVKVVDSTAQVHSDILIDAYTVIEVESAQVMGSDMSDMRDVAAELERLKDSVIDYGTVRGVEKNFQPQLSQKVKDCRKELVRKVLAEQQKAESLQSDSDDEKGEALRAISVEVSKPSVAWAQVLGKIDHQVVEMEKEGNTFLRQ